MTSKGTVTLMPWQERALPLLLSALAKRTHAALDCSDLGTGKTYTAAFAADAARAPGTRVVVVCPKAVIPSWRRVFLAMGLRAEDDFIVVNYEALRRGVGGVAGWDASGKRFCWAPSTGFVIFDEAHKLKSPDVTLNGRMAIGATLQKIPRLFLSATLAESPAHLRVVGHALGLHDGTHFVKWAGANGCGFDPWGKPVLRRTVAVKVMRDLNALLFPEHGVRVRRSDIPDFPDCDLRAEAFDFGVAGGINKAYEEMEDELAALAEKEEADGKRVKDTAKMMVAQLRARQKVELLKVAGVVSLAEDAVEEGQSVVVFCNFRATLDALHEKLRGLGVGVVAGGQSAAVRQQAIDDFQSDRIRVILVQIQSGGAGLSLHDLNGAYPRLALIFPCFSAVDLRQSTGRIHRAGAKSKAVQRILFAAGTVEERVMAKLNTKLKDLDNLNDGDVMMTDTQVPPPPPEPEKPPDTGEESEPYHERFI